MKVSPAETPPTDTGHLYQRIFDHSLDAFIAIDERSKILDWSKQAEKTYGWTKVEVLGLALTETIIPVRYHAALMADLKRFLPPGNGTRLNRRIELHARSKDGTEIPAELTVTPIKVAERMIFSASLRDISQQRKLQAAIQQQMRLLQAQASLLELTPNAILVRDADDVITYWNSSAERLYKFSREEAIGQVSHTLLATRCQRPLAELRAVTLEKHFWEGELIHVTKDGDEIIVFSQWALELEDGRPSRYLETNSDITQRVTTERALRQSQENFRMLVEASTDYAILMMDVNGTILSWNAGAEKIIGLSEQEAIGRPISVIFTSEDKSAGEPLRELNDARTNGRSDDDRWHMKKDGSRFWANGVVTPLRNEDGSLRGYVKILRDQTEQRLMEEQTRFLASHDMLTGLSNRASFSSQLHQSIALAERNRVPFAILLLDLDQFKYVNDTFGHHTGDLLLKEIAMRILSVLRETDFVARLGGDEFVVIQSDVRQPEAAEILASKIVQELGHPYFLEGNEVTCGTSIGISIYPRDAKSSLELMKCADLALYQAKHAGRHTHRVYTADLALERAWKEDQERQLRRALENHEFELYYQPQIDVSNWTVVSVEVLLRWHAGGGELVLPTDFLDAAEKSGVIVEIGQWALLQACRQSMEWQDKGLPGFRISFNCSARQFTEQKFVGMMRCILSDTGIAPDRLELEIADSTFARQPEIKAQLAELRALGIRIVVDNFGTGTTSFADLKDFPVDALKIDKTLVQHLPHRREDSAITSTIINLAHNLEIGVIAGGVETAEQLAYLIARNCTCAQGFIFSPPVPAEELKELLVYGYWSRVNPLHAHHPLNQFKN